MTDSGQIYENYSSERETKARRVKVIEFKGYNSKIVSAGKDLERRSPKTRAIIYVPGSSHTYIQQNEQYIIAHIT